MRADPVHELAAIDLYGAIKLGEIAGDELGEATAVAGNPVSKLSTSQREHLLERTQPGGHHVLNGVALAINRRGEVVGGRAEAFGHIAGAGDDRLANPRPGLLELGHNIAAT